MFLHSLMVLPWHPGGVSRHEELPCKFISRATSEIRSGGWILRAGLEVFEESRSSYAAGNSRESAWKKRKVNANRNRPNSTNAASLISLLLYVLIFTYEFTTSNTNSTTLTRAPQRISRVVPSSLFNSLGSFISEELFLKYRREWTEYEAQ